MIDSSFMLTLLILLFLPLTGYVFYLRHQLQLQDKKLAQNSLLIETMYDIFWIMDPETNRFVYVSPAVERMRGYSVEEIMQDTVDAALTEDAQKVVRKTIFEECQKFLAGEINEQDYFIHQLPQPCKDGSLVWTEVVTHYFTDPSSGKVLIHGITRDITERHKLDEKVRYLANHDPLTGLLNRNAFFETGELWFWDAKQKLTPLALLSFDLDAFKPLNDTYGHAFGDEVLKAFAQLLQESFGDSEQTLIARLGGDEFSVLILNPTQAQITQKCETLYYRLNQNIKIQQRKVPLQTSIGSAFLMGEASLSQLSITADKTLYQNKKRLS